MRTITKFVGGPCHGEDIPQYLINRAGQVIRTLAPHSFTWSDWSPLSPASMLHTLTYRKVTGYMAGSRVTCWAYDELSTEELTDLIKELIFPELDLTPSRPLTGPEIVQNITAAYERMNEMLDRAGERERDELILRDMANDQAVCDRINELVRSTMPATPPRQPTGSELSENLRQAYALIEQIDRDERIAPLYYDPITRPPERWRGRDHDPFTAPLEDWRVVALPSEGGWTDPTQREQYEQIEQYLLDDDGNVSPDAVRFRPRSQ